MSLVTHPRLRSALAAVAVGALLLGAAGCDSGDDIDGDRDRDGSSGQATDDPAVTTVTTLEQGDGIDATHQDRLVSSVTTLVDTWFDGGFLGEFPRADFTGAFASFTRDAAADAETDLDLMSNAGIADQIDTATATNRRVRLYAFAPGGHPRGVTAAFVLDFETQGDLEQRLRVHGSLYLTRAKGEWKVFGYDVDQAVAL